MPETKLYTREEVINMLEFIYCHAAYYYNDYGRTDFDVEASNFVKGYMSDK